jgi:hypothetical protein
MWANQNSYIRTGLCNKFKPQSQNPTRKWWTHQLIILKWSTQSYECSGKRMGSIGQRLARYDQNSEQTFLLKLPGGHDWLWTGYVQFRRIYPVIEPDMSGLSRNFLLTFDSWATGHQNGWNLDTSVTSTQVTSFQWGFSQIQRFSFRF